MIRTLPVIANHLALAGPKEAALAHLGPDDTAIAALADGAIYAACQSARRVAHAHRIAAGYLPLAFGP